MRRWNDKLRPVELFELDKQAHKMIVAFLLWQQNTAGMSDEELERLARERLALVLPGEKIFYFVTDREEHQWNLQSGQY